MSSGRGASDLLDTGHVSPSGVFVIDYDLPADSRRKRFYRAIKRYLAEKGWTSTGWSTGSVVWTESEDFAWYVYREARKVGGTAHVWRAQRLDTKP